MIRSLLYTSEESLSRRLLLGLITGTAAALLLYAFDLTELPSSPLIVVPIIMLASLRWGARAGLVTGLPSLLYYILPVPGYPEGEGLDGIVGIVEIAAIFAIIPVLAGRSRQMTMETRERAQLQATLRKLSHDLAGTGGMENVCRRVVDTLQDRHGYGAAIVLIEHERLEMMASSGTIELTDSDRATIANHMEENLRQGIVLSLENRFVYPLLSAGNLLGLLIVQSSALATSTISDRHGMLKAMAMTIATAIQREILAERSMEADLHRRHEHLYAALLSSISHDFRTPLASIIGAAETLAMPQAILSDGARRDMVSMIREEADRLNRFVANLLDMTKLESGALELNLERVEVGDLVGTAIMRTRRQTEGYDVEIEVPLDLPMVSVDFVLFEHVLTNLIENAVKYSERGTTIRIEAEEEAEWVRVRIIDQGRGIPIEELERVFEKFYRVQRGDKVSAGTGLGLSICQGIVQAHGGNIRAVSPVSQSGTGTMFVLSLPLRMQTVSKPSEGAADSDPESNGTVSTHHSPDRAS